MYPNDRVVLLLSGDWVLLQGGEVLRDGAVAVAGNLITAVGSREELVARYPDARQLGGNGCLITPGFFNTHTHLFQTYLKGLGQGLPLVPWIKKVTLPASLVMSPDDAYHSAVLGLIEAVRSGSTSVFEYSYAFPDHEIFEAVFQAFIDVGVRGWLGVGANDTGEDAGIHPALIHPLAETFAIVDNLRNLAAEKAAGLVKLALAPGSLRGLTPEGAGQIHAYCKDHGLHYSMHINETQNDNEICMRRNGLRVLPLLSKVGALGPELLAVHCVVADDEDIRLMSEYGVSVSHNPVSNMYLGSGIAPVVAMRRSGIPLCLGTDGAASNNAQDMLETLKLSALGQRVLHGDPQAFNAEDAFEMATAESARALGVGEKLGAIAPGMLADLVVFETRTAKMEPIHDPVASIVFSCSEENVHTVVINGRVIMEGKCLTNIDENSLLRKAAFAAKKLVERAGISGV